MNNEIELFKEYFYYSDGALFWKKDAGARAKKGKTAGKLRKDGYYDVGLKGKYYLVHRIVFALTYGYLPACVDHIDRNPSNNLISNLRDSDYSNNVWNSGISKSNSTGIKGIRVARNGKFEARVAANGVTYQVGTFDNIEEAASELKKFRANLHKNFACNG